MRQQVLDYISSLALGGYLVSQEMPWSDNGVPLYIKNLRKIYVDHTEFSSAPLFSTLGTLMINEETQTTRIYFANDSKTVPSNYQDVVADLRAVNNISILDGSNRREVDVSVTYESDVMITELEIRFTKISS